MRRSLILAATIVVVPFTAAAQPAPRATPPLPVPPVRHDRDAYFATPRYYAITASGLMARQDGWKICMGGEGMRKIMAATDERMAERKAKGELGKGCTHHFEQTDGGPMITTMDCETSAGAAHTSHMRSTFAGGTLTQHLEMLRPDPDHPGMEKTIVSDMTLTSLGACPAGMKGGEYIDRDGKHHDMVADVEAVEAKTPKAPGAK